VTGVDGDAWAMAGTEERRAQEVEDRLLMRCEVCAGIDPTCRWRPDPYQADVNNTTVLRILCDHCERELALDI
jgi:hypothetical protein